MAKKYLLKILLLCILFIQVFTNASAQYAIGGTAGANLVNSVYWLTWDQTATGSTLISQPAGASGSNLINGTYVWQFSPTVRITAIISNLQTTLGTSMLVYTPGSYFGDGLDLIYSGNNLPKPDSRGVPASGISAPYGGTATFDIDVKVAILINNVYTDVVYPGMIIADAESIDAGGEYISGTTPNSIAWQLLNKRSQGNAADDHYKLDLTDNGRSFKLYADLLPGNFGVQAVMFAHGARELDNVSMKGSGLTAMAIGFVLPFDLGDDPEGYGTAGQYMEQFQITDYFAGDGTYAVIDYNTTPLIAKATVFMGADNVDPDGQPVGTENANNDNVTGNDDENTLNPATRPDVKVNQAGSIVVTLPVTNKKNTPARLYGWLDFNQDGIFNADEQLNVNVPANTNNQNFTLTYTNSFFAGKIKTGPLYTRFRVTTSTLIDNTGTPIDERSLSFAADGETEDYRFKDILGINISGSVFNDGNGGLDGVISGAGLPAVSEQPLYAYLVNNNTIIAKAPVDGEGKYALTNINNGTYRVAISTNDVAIGGSLADVVANLPDNWKPSGEAYGTNNTGNTGIEAGTPNLQIQVTTPGNSLNVSGVNFGINQIPVAVADAGSTNIGTAITLNIPGNDTDADGTLNLTQVLLIDPADNIKKTSVTIAGQGTYSVNTTTGRVTFTPLATFTGKTVPLAYTIKDNFGSESVSALITIDVKPAGMSDTDITAVGTPVTTTVKDNDGAAAAPATVTATAGTHGTTTVDNGTVTYTPNPGYTGIDTYTYTLITPDGVVSDPITVTITINPPSIVLSKVAANGGNKAGDVINYNLAITNTGLVTLTNVVVTDAGADAGSITPASIATLAAGASVTVTAKHTLTQADVNTGSYSNQATVTGRDPESNPVTAISDDPTTAEDGDPTVVTIAAPGAITITKAGVFSENFITYTFVVTNTGSVTLNTVAFTDANLGLNNSAVTIPAGGLVPGASVSFNYAYTLTQANKDAGTVNNTASITARDPDNNIVTDDASVTVTVIKSPIAVNDASLTFLNQPKVIEILKNDDPGNSSFNLQSIEIITQPAHGTVQAGNGVVTYTPNPNYSGPDEFTYRVKDLYGFYTNVATVTISISPNATFKMPTLFTPNGDGINDVFEIRGIEQFAQNELSIVNRWGNEVYRQKGYQNTWAGTGLNEGTYYYILRVLDTDGTNWTVYKGYVTLIRTFKK